MMLAFSISYTLHLAVPTRFIAFDIVSQGGADVKDCSEFKVFLNNYGLFYDEENSKKCIERKQKCSPTTCHLKLLQR